MALTDLFNFEDPLETFYSLPYTQRPSATLLAPLAEEDENFDFENSMLSEPEKERRRKAKLARLGYPAARRSGGAAQEAAEKIAADSGKPLEINKAVGAVDVPEKGGPTPGVSEPPVSGPTPIATPGPDNQYANPYASDAWAGLSAYEKKLRREALDAKKKLQAAEDNVQGTIARANAEQASRQSGKPPLTPTPSDTFMALSLSGTPDVNDQPVGSIPGAEKPVTSVYSAVKTADELAEDGLTGAEDLTTNFIQGPDGKRHRLSGKAKKIDSPARLGETEEEYQRRLAVERAGGTIADDSADPETGRIGRLLDAEGNEVGVPGVMRILKSGKMQHVLEDGTTKDLEESEAFGYFAKGRVEYQDPEDEAHYKQVMEKRRGESLQFALAAVKAKTQTAVVKAQRDSLVENSKRYRASIAEMREYVSGRKFGGYDGLTSRQRRTAIARQQEVLAQTEEKLAQTDAGALEFHAAYNGAQETWRTLRDFSSQYDREIPGMARADVEVIRGKAVARQAGDKEEKQRLSDLTGLESGLKEQVGKMDAGVKEKFRAWSKEDMPLFPAWKEKNMPDASEEEARAAFDAKVEERSRTDWRAFDMRPNTGYDERRAARLRLKQTQKSIQDIHAKRLGVDDFESAPAQGNPAAATQPAPGAGPGIGKGVGEFAGKNMSEIRVMIQDRQLKETGKTELTDKELNDAQKLAAYIFQGGKVAAQ